MQCSVSIWRIILDQNQIVNFVDPGVKVNGQYYRDILLTRDLLPDVRQYSDYFTFQQDGAPAQRARETVELLKVETPDFIPPNLWPPNSHDLNPVDYKNVDLYSALRENTANALNETQCHSNICVFKSRRN